MNFDNITIAPALVSRRPTGQCPLPDERCSDLEWAADHPEVCPDASTITGLKVVPDVGEMEVGKRFVFRAYLLFADGKRQEVTSKSAWVTSNGGVARVDAEGMVTGVGMGSTTVQATYRGFFDFAQVSVLVACAQAGMDIVVVIDRSAGMGDTLATWGEWKGADERTLLDATKDAVAAMVRSVDFAKDRVSIVSCAGVYNEAEAVPYHSDAKLHIVLSGSEDDVLSAVDSVQMGNCSMENSSGYHVTECATGLGAGLAKAKEELTSARARYDARKVVVLVSLGWEVYCTPNPVTIAAEMRDENYTVIGVVVCPSIDYTWCQSGGVTGTNWAYVQQMVSCGLFYGAENPDDLPAILGGALYDLCIKGQEGDPCVYFIPPVIPVPKTCYRDRLDYDGFKNWNVISGHVDLIGIDLYPFIVGHGLYVDLVGTHVEMVRDELKRPVGQINPVGVIETKQNYLLAPGRYRITVELAGNHRQDLPGFKVRVQVGSLFSRIVTIDDWQQDFTPYSWDFSVTSATAAKIKISQNALPSGVNNRVGTLLDNVKLENLDTGKVLLLDTFDEENPCP